MIRRNKAKRNYFVANYTLYRPKYELCKIKWEFNPYDNDFNPNLSIPHGDDISPSHHTLKLNADNGCIYTSRNRSFYGKLTKKELQRLLLDPGFKNVRKLAQEYHQNKRSITKSCDEPYSIELECYKLK